MDDDLEYRRAKRQVHLLRSFYIHLSVFIPVMVLLLAINIATGRGWWVQWPLMGWGIGVGAHALVVFGVSGWLGPDWEERKIKELMAKK